MASSSDDEVPLDATSVEFVAGNAARMTVEVVLAAGIRPGQRIAYESNLGMVEFTVPSDVPGRKFRMDVVPSSTGAWCLASDDALTTDGSECSRRGSSVGGPTGGREDGDGHSRQDNFSATVVAADRTKVTIELVVPEDMQPGELIRFTPPVGMPVGMRHPETVRVKVPSELLPGRKFRGTLLAKARSTDGSGSSHSSEHLGPVTREVAECVAELCGMQRADGPAGSQQARTQLLTQLSQLVASDEELREARVGTVLAYLGMFEQLRRADGEAAQLILAALHAGGPSPERDSPLQAIHSLHVEVRDGTRLDRHVGNFVGFDIDSGRRVVQLAACPPLGRRPLLTRVVHDGRCRVSLRTSKGGRHAHDVPPDQLRPCESEEEVQTEMLVHALCEGEGENPSPSRAREIARQVACLLATGSDPNGNVELKNGDAVSMLFVATKRRKPDVKLVFLLLAAGADPHASSPRPYGSWSLAKALTSRELDASFHGNVFRFLEADCDTLLEECRSVEDWPDNEIGVSDIASFFRNLRKEDLLHAAAALCNFESLCQLLYCPSPKFDPDREINLNGALVSPLSLAYYSRDPDSHLCVYSLLAARADPYMPSMERKLGEGFWTLAGAARVDEQADMLQTLKQIPLRTLVHPGAAADWIWSRISCVGVTTAMVESMLEYLVPCMYLDELVREVLTERAASPEDEEPFAELYWKLAEQLLCVSARFNDDKTVELLLREETDVDSLDDSKRSAAPTHCQSLQSLLARFLTRPDRPAQVCAVARRRQWQRAARAEAARRWRQVQPCR